MVKILLVVPYQGVWEEFSRLVSEVEDPDIQVEMSHIAGTKDILDGRCSHDIVVARGITYQAIRDALPEIHLIEIGMTGFDVANAIAQAKRRFAPNRIAILMNDPAIANLRQMEELCGVPIEAHDILNEQQIARAIESASRNGADAFIGGLTMCQQCDERGLHRIHIKTGSESVRLAIAEAVNTARTLNQERVKARLLQGMFDSTREALLAVDRHGALTAVNNQAYQLCRVPLGEEMVGRGIEQFLPQVQWSKSLETGLEVERLYTFQEKPWLVNCKPIIVDERTSGVLLTVQNAERISEAESKIRKELSAKGLTAKYRFGDIIGGSGAMRSNITNAYKYSLVDSNVLIMGETGTGKELFAHSMHSASRRSEQPFVAINCAALPENLLESELFGYAPGAFSGASKGGKVGLFELAHRGTIFLDEIGEMPISLQAKLLRVLQEREIRRLGDDKVIPVDVRVISATNVNIRTAIEQGVFRADLYYRLNLLNLKIPPLRERTEDIPEMLEAFVRRFVCDYERPAPSLTAEAMTMLRGYAWPGNVRELRNFCERLVVLGEDRAIGPAELLAIGPFEDADSQPETSAVAAKAPDPLDEELLRLMAQKRIGREELAKQLGISRTTLWRKMRELNL